MAEHTARVLIVEDDADIASALSRGLNREGYETAVARDADTAQRLAGQGFEALIVDVMLGVTHGTELVRRLRSKGFTAPIIMLSALSAVEDRARGLEAGADDYIAKPFEFAELVARLRVQERCRINAEKLWGLAALSYDPDLRQAAIGNIFVALTQREGELLAFLMARAGKVVSRGEIFDSLWLEYGGSSENVVDVYIGYLRRKLEPLFNFGVQIRTVRGRGFLLTESTHE